MGVKPKPEVLALRNQLLEIIREHGPIRRGQIEQMAELSERQGRKTVDNQLQRLKMDGAIKYSVDGTWRMANVPAPDVFLPPSEQRRPQPPVKPVVTRTRAQTMDTSPNSTAAVMAGTAPRPCDDPPIIVPEPTLSGSVLMNREAQAAGAAAVSGEVVMGIDIRLRLTRSDVLELAERMPAVMQAAGALMALQVELEDRHAEQSGA